MEPCRSVSATRVPAFRSPASSCAPAKRRCSSASSTTCRSSTSGPPGVPSSLSRYRHASEDTLRHLIITIEQLKSKDKVISQLERELGHPAVVAGPVSMATEVTRASSSGQYSNKMETPQLSPQTLLSGLSQAFQRLHGTSVVSFPHGGEEKGTVEGFAGLEAEILGLHDRAQALALDRQNLLDKVKDIDVKNKQLVEKNRRFLEKNVELTAQNRSLKDGNHTLQQQRKKSQNESEDSHRRLVELARELQRVRSQCLELEDKAQHVDELKKQISDQTNSITMLRQACTDKDRRIELIQHRKKRRRLIRSQEKCQGMKETFYGYDDDDNDVSIDSETSLSSVSISTISEEDACDELNRQELERSHRQMLREHLQLERAHALLQSQTESSQDPHRELQSRSQLQADLFSAQCRVELLEKEIRSLQSSANRRRGSSADGGLSDADIKALLRERESLLAARTSLQLKLEQVDGECARLKQELRMSEERADELEFRILELEEIQPDPGYCPHEGHDHDPRRGNDFGSDLHFHGDDLGPESSAKASSARAAECLIQASVAAVTTSAVAAIVRPVTPSPDSVLPEEDEPAGTEDEDSMDLSEKLRRELTAALEKQGVRAESVLKGLTCLKDAEQKVSSMERMAMELQNKVINLQQERDGLEEQLMRGAPISVTAEVERRQNLELKDEVARLAEAREESCSENARLCRQLEESETLCMALKEQLKEFLGPSGEICLGSNKTDLEKAGQDMEKEEDKEEDKQTDHCVREAVQLDHKWTQTKETGDTKRSPSSKEKKQAQTQTIPLKAEEDETLQEQLKTLEAENVALRDKMEQVRKRRSPDSSSDEDDPFLQASTPSSGQKSKQKVKTLERQLQVLHSENTRLAEKLGGYSPRNTDEMIERIMELEDQSADLQERVYEAEGHERQMREKLRLAEQTINELELSEAQYRDKCDELSSLEKETKKQLHNLVTTGRELREIVMDKDIVEQSLREKVDFLEKVEAQSSQRINELEALETSLREQLEARDATSDNSTGHHATQGPGFTALQEKLAAAEREVHQLKERNNELEENEEILRENWRRVADEDANRIMCLEEKVRMLDQINHDLKGKLSEAQDFVVINSGPPSKGSLAEELSASTSRRPRQARPHCGSPIEGGSDEDSGEETVQVSRLQRQLSIMKEEKNSKIATLQEKLAKMKENEIKLSETLAEMEMTERELRAKLALYESSEVTVEKMLKYQDKIHELRTSQESLLDQLETMESQEMSLQEQLEETERRYKGKIVVLEVEMKNLKQKELKGNARIRELEKHEAELTEKTKIQSEKENGLYVRISGLMDQVKEHQAKVSTLEKKLEEKDERCRKIASLETKFFQIEGAYKEKVTSLETALAEAQSSQAEERQQAEEAVMALGEQVATLEASLESQEKEQSQRVFILQEMFAQKEKGLDERIASLEKELADKEANLSMLEAELGEKDSKISELKEVVSSKDSEGSEFEKNLSTKDNLISELEEDLSTKTNRISELEEDVSLKDSRICKLEVDLNTKFNRISELEEDLSTKYRRASELEEVISERDSAISKLEESLRDKDSRFNEMEKDLRDKDTCVTELKKEVSERQACVSDLEKDLTEKASHVSELERNLAQKESQISEAAKDLNELNQVKGDVLKKDNRIEELKRAIQNQTAQISEMEVCLKEKESCVSQQEGLLAERQSQIKQLKEDFRLKCSQVVQLEEELSRKGESLSGAEETIRDKASCISRLEADIRDKDSHVRELEAKLDDTETQVRDKDSHVCELEAKLDDRETRVRDLGSQLEAKCREHSEALEQAHLNIASKDTHVAEMEERVVDMSSTITQLHTAAGERDSKLSDLEKQLLEKDTVVSQHVSQLQMELNSNQKSSTDKISSLEEELETTKLELSRLDAKLSESSKQLEQVQTKLDEEREKVASAAKSHQEVEAEKDGLLEQITSMNSDFEARLREQDGNFQQQMSVRESEFHQACSSLEAECESLRKEQQDKNLVIENLESNKNDLLSKIENLKDRERDLTNKLSTLEKDSHSLHSQEEEMKHEVSELEQQLKDSEKERHKAIEKQAALETDILSLNQTVERQTGEITRLGTEVQEARSEAQNLQEKLTELQHQEMQSSRQTDSLLQQEAMLKAQVAQAEAQLETKSKNLDQQKHGTAELEQQKQNLEAALLQVQTDLSDSHILNASLQEQLSQLTLQTTSLQEEVARLTAQLQTHLTQEERLQEMLDLEKSRMQDLESQIGSLKDEKKSALAKVEEVCSELNQSQETVKKLEKEILSLSQNEEVLKAEIVAEQNAKTELAEKLGQAAEETNIKEEKFSQLERVAIEKDEEIQRVKADLLSQSQQLESEKLAKSSMEEKDKELLHLQQREKSLQDRITSMENQMGRYQEDHSQMCQKLQELEKREKELLEQMTDIEQTVIVPLETENTELKEEVVSIKQQNDDLNLQLDKQEERAREDFEELEGLRDSVINLQQTRTEIQSKLDAATKDLNSKDEEKSDLESRLASLETCNKNLEDQLENNRVELDKIELEFNKEMCSREAQTELDVSAMEATQQSMQNKLTVLQDAEDKFMSRIVDLEEREQQLTEQLESARQRLQEKDQCNRETQTEVREDTQSPTPASPGTVDVCVFTDGIQEAKVTKVPELFTRVQELESTNQRLSASLEQATVDETDRKQLTDKLRLLEQSEDRLMERVMELEEAEIMLRTQVDRLKHRAKVADELEEEVSELLQQEDDLKEKVNSLTSQNSSLSEKLDAVQTQLTTERTKNESLSHQVQAEDRQLQDTQKELRLVQTKLQAVRSEYEEKLSALEESEKKIENQLDTQSQQEGDLRQEVRVLKEEMEDVCERYKELELENSTLKQQHSKVLVQLKETEARCIHLGLDSASETNTIQAAQAATSLSALPQGGNVSLPGELNSVQQSSSPQMCSNNTSIKTVQSSSDGAQNSESSSVHEESLLARISQLEKQLSEAQQRDSSIQQSSVASSKPELSSAHSDSNLSDEVQSPPSLSVKILTLPEALKENASLKAQLQDLTSRLQSSALKDSEELSGEEKESSMEKQSAEISRLQARVGELEESLVQAEGAVQEVVTVIRTRSVHTLEQKIETIMHTIHTQSPAWPLHQELLELLTSQADLQKQVSHLMETEHNLRLALKQTEDELSRVKSGTGATTLSAGRRLSVQSRLSRFGGGVTSSKTSATTTHTSPSTDTTSKEKHQWLERQVADLQLAKNSLERRLHEAERRLAFRPRPTAASKEELQFRLDQLQEEQTQWRHKVEDLEALNSHYLKEKLELAQERNVLENKLQEQGLTASGKDLNSVFVGGPREEPLGSSGSVSEGESGTPGDAMLEKPEDVLHKRISELENLESYLKQQLSEVETDREQLHEITRKDKATIHQQNVRLRELMLTERNLRSQVSGLEDSERSLYNRCSELEDSVARLEDRVHELEVHERRLRELVRKLKLDEEVWLSRSGDLASSMELLSSSEVTLRKTVHDLQMQRGGLSDRAEHLEARVKELETLEASLVQRLKNYENVEASLQSRLRHLENSEAAALSKASELEVINMDLSSRLQRAVEENAVLSQHVAQQQGQIHELDRKLTASADAEVGLAQHVESLQKNEGSLQKKVREYELKEIDAQARVRELEQTEELLKDKINQLQRSENRLKARLVEFESVGSQQMLENLVPAQRQQLPQTLEECQKRVVVLQRELETAQAELHQRPQLQSASHDATTVKVPTAAFAEMRAKVALLEDAEYQLSELEKLNTQLSQNILQLQQGKGSCGHEVELEVLKKRLQSSQNLIQNLKHHLSEGQVPSLLAADAGQGLESEDLPGRDLQCLEAERVLHSVRSLTKPPGLAHTHEEIIQPQSSTTTEHALRAPVAPPSEPEESHWRRVELRHPQHGAEQRGASASMPHASAATTAATAASAPRQEELMIGLSLASESERGSQKSQNDTDSEMSGALHHHTHPTPRSARVGGSTPRGSNPGAVPSPGSPRGTRSHPPPMPTSSAPFAHQKQQRSGFVRNDSFYLPSPGQSESESMEGDEAPPLPASAPPGAQQAAPVAPPQQSSPLASVKVRGGGGASTTATPVAKKVFVSAVTLPSAGQSSADGSATQEGRSGSVMGLSIRQRIAQIESHLKEKPSSKAGSKTEDDVFTWKAKATENARLLGIAERESKQLKEDINKLEKDLEEKRRCIDIFEKWILDAEEVLKNKNKKHDRDLVQQLQTEVKHLKQDLANAGYRKDDIFTDPAALKTELDHKERELSSKQTELESLVEEIKQWQLEYGNVEAMRRNALDSLRLLETEVTQLQDADIQLKQMKDDYNTLRGQLEDVWNRYKELNQTLSDKDDLEFTLKRTILERDHLKIDLDKVTQERDVLEPQLRELRSKVRDLSNVQAENSSLELQVSNMDTTLKERTQKVRELYEENMSLHDRFTELQHRLDQLRETRRDLDNMCARYDEVDMEKNKAVAAVHTLRAKVARLSSKCQEKDELLRRLSSELRGGRGRSSSLMEELTRLETMAAGEEYNRPMSPLDLIAGPASSVDSERLLSERVPQATTFTRSPSSSSLGDPCDPSTSNDRSSLRRPKSAEHVRKVLNQSGVMGSAKGHGRETLYVAILDYQPETASQSGHRSLELPLKEGDQVRVRGPVDRHGYCEAEVGGRAGLVPASHLYPINDGGAPYTNRQNHRHHGLLKKSSGDSAEQIVQMFDDFQDHRLLTGAKHHHAPQASHATAAHSAATQTRQRRSQVKNSAAPQAPSNLHIQEVEGSSVLLAWQPPALDQQGCSNGSRVVGYRIYLNGRVCQQPHNPRLSQTRVEGVRHDRPQQLAIQTLAASGQQSARVELVYQGLSEASHGHRSQEELEADTDLSSVLNSIQYKIGKKHMMMGLYDYDPEKQSPGDYVSCELAFHAGDILTVYGDVRQDGFFHGERNGQRGLVPACFVEPVTEGAKSTQKHGAANGSTSPGGR